MKPTFKSKLDQGTLVKRDFINSSLLKDFSFRPKSMKKTKSLKPFIATTFGLTKPKSCD